MATHNDELPVDISQEKVQSALTAFWSGRYEEFDQLLEGDRAEGSSGLCSMFGALIEFQVRPSIAGLSIPGYTVLRRIGQGAMGVVFEAAHERTRRSVALKIISTFGRSLDDLKTYERELNSLSRLKHPNIATLYDSGTTADGRSFVAMELVAGSMLHRKFPSLENEKLTTAELNRRLAAFCRVCDAVHYAHQRGVIHRDLKPANILIDESDQPKVLDFGLARLIDPDASLVSTIIDGSKLIGTLSYMSPEQASANAAEIDIRSDCFSLGVILYESLTGRNPHFKKGSPIPAVIRSICEEPPPRPSELQGMLRGDLELIILKSLEKDPARRYQSAAEFCDDIKRFLSDRPIIARAPSAGYLFRKFVSRHRAVSALALLLFVLTTIAVVVFVNQSQMVRQERNAAQISARRAEQANRVLTGMLIELNPTEVGMQIPMRDLLARTESRIETELADMPEAQATVHDALGRAFLSLREPDNAEKHLSLALELRKQTVGERDPEYLSALHQMACVIQMKGDTKRAREFVNEAYRLRIELLGENHVDVAESLEFLGRSAMIDGDFDRGIEYCRKVIDIRRANLGRHPLVAKALQQCALNLVWAGRYDEAEPLLNEALDMQRMLLGNDHFDVAMTLKELGEIAQTRGNIEEAERVYREQVRVLTKVFAPDGNKELSHAISDLATMLELRDEWVEAERLYLEAIDMERRTVPGGKSDLTGNNYAVFLREQGRYAEALPYSQSVYEGWHSGNPGTINPGYSYSAQNLGMVLLELGRLDEAGVYLDEAEKVWRTLSDPPHPKLANALMAKARIQRIRGDSSSSAGLYKEAFEIRRDRLGENNVDTQMARLFLLRSQAENELMEGAVGQCGVVLNIIKELSKGNPSNLVMPHCIVGDIFLKADNAESALMAFQEALRIERSLPRTGHPNLAVALTGLSESLYQLSRTEDAESAATEALEICRTAFAPDDARTRRATEILDKIKKSNERPIE